MLRGYGHTRTCPPDDRCLAAKFKGSLVQDSNPLGSCTNKMSRNLAFDKAEGKVYAAVQSQQLEDYLGGLSLMPLACEEGNGLEQSSPMALSLHFDELFESIQHPIEMTGIMEDMAFLKASVEYFKLHIRKVYEAACAGLKENTDTIENMKYISQQLAFKDSQIDELERSLIELMGTVDVIKEEILKMEKMTQCSHFQESPAGDVLPMDEISVHQQV